jgi:Sec-independent protein translocase protein TatE
VSMEGISITKLLVIAVLVILLFGTSKLRTLGADLGAALKGFKKAVGDDSTPPAAGSNTAESQSAQQSVEKKDV